MYQQTRTEICNWNKKYCAVAVLSTRNYRSGSGRSKSWIKILNHKRLLDPSVVGNPANILKYLKSDCSLVITSYKWRTNTAINLANQRGAATPNPSWYRFCTLLFDIAVQAALWRSSASCKSHRAVKLAQFTTVTSCNSCLHLLNHCEGWIVDWNYRKIPYFVNARGIEEVRRRIWILATAHLYENQITLPSNNLPQWILHSSTDHLPVVVTRKTRRSTIFNLKLPLNPLWKSTNCSAWWQ